MQRRIKWAALLLAAMLLTGCAQQTEIAPPQLIEPVGVQSDMAAAYIGEIYDITYYDASVKPYVEEMAFEVDGKVVELNGYPGMLVEEGDVIIELDQTSLQERADQLRRELEYAEKDNALTDAMTELDIEMLQAELRQLKAQGADEQAIALKENDIAQKQAALRQTQALREPDLKKKRDELAEISISLDKNVMRAPFSGRIIYGDMIAQGSWVSEGDPVVYLADDSQLTIISEYIPESAVKTAARIYAHIGSKQYEIEYQPIERDEYISLVLSGATLTSRFEIVGPQEDLDELAAGQYAAICLWHNYVPDALLVPSGAVLKDASGRYVYVDENGTRVRRQVKVGRTTDGLAQILEGLEEGEVVYVKD